MKKIILLLFISLCILVSGCKKDSGADVSGVDENSTVSINFEAVKKAVDSAPQLSPEIAVYISILHKNYINNLSIDPNSITEEAQIKLYDDEKKKFFGSIKFTEKEYEDYFNANTAAINDYIQTHPELMDFLTILK